MSATGYGLKQIAAWLMATAIMITTLGTIAEASDSVIAVAAEADHAGARVSSVAARAPYILLFDAAGELMAAHPNPVAASPSGAGPALAAWLAEQKVKVLIAGDFGTKLTPALKTNSIRAVTASGPAAQAVKEVK